MEAKKQSISFMPSGDRGEKRILIYNDDDEIQFLFKTILSTLHYKVATHERVR